MKKNDSIKLKLCPFSLGIAIGIIDGLYMLLLGWGAWLWGYGHPFIEQVGGIFYGYAPTLLGGVLGGIWGFVEGFIFGVLVGLIYNLCACPCCKKSSAKGE